MRELQCLALTPDDVVLRGHLRFSGSVLLKPAVLAAGVTTPAEEAGEQPAGEGPVEAGAGTGGGVSGEGAGGGAAAVR